VIPLSTTSAYLKLVVIWFTNRYPKTLCDKVFVIVQWFYSSLGSSLPPPPHKFSLPQGRTPLPELGWDGTKGGCAHTVVGEPGRARAAGGELALLEREVELASSERKMVEASSLVGAPTQASCFYLSNRCCKNGETPIPPPVP
jgi:hypothetical protein